MSWSTRLGVTLALCASACGGSTGPNDAWALSRGLIDGGRVEVVVPDGEPDRLARLEAAEVEERGRFSFVFLHPGAGSAAGALVARCWIGTPGTPGAEDALARLGVQPLPAGENGGGFHFLGREYRAANDALCATLADPRAAGRVLTVLLANDAASAARLFAGWTPTWVTGFQTRRGGLVEREGRLRPDGRVVPGSEIVLDDEHARVFESSRTLDLGAFEFILPKGLEQPDRAWVEGLERARARAAELAGEGEGARQRLRVFLYTHVEDKARLSRDWAPGSLDPATGWVHAVHGDTGLGGAAFAVARASALAQHGPPRAAWITDAVAAASVDEWWGRPMDVWLAHLHSGGATPELAELLAPEPRRSPHVITPMRGALVRHLADLRGPGEVRALWSGARRITADDASLRASFHRWLDGLVERHGPELKTARAARLAAGTSSEFRRGVNLCAEQGQDDPFVEGFGTRVCDDSLRRAKEIGANAVAFVLDAWIELPPQRPGAAPRYATASDAALAQCARRAGELDLGVMLRPRLLYAPASNWAGVMMMTMTGRQERFFALYGDFVEHYALLAELLPDCEILCIGGETPEATATVPRGENPRESPFFELRRAGWRTVIARARGAFSGALTYAARWGNEAHTIEFWPALDFVSKNFFSSLAVQGTDRPPTEKEISGQLGWSMQQLVELGRKHGRPALVTEIGCSSSADAWRDPASILGAVDLDLQRNFYVGLESALRRGERDGNRPAGIYIWCWSSDPRVGGNNDRQFTPQNKPAEGVLRAIFRRS